MNNSEKILKIISAFIENGILSKSDLKKEILTNLKFKKDELIDKMDLVSKDEFNILKKIVQKQEKKIKDISKKRQFKKVKKL